MDYDSLNDAFRDLRSEVDELEDAVKSGTVQEKNIRIGRFVVQCSKYFAFYRR